MKSPSVINPADEMLPVRKLATLGLQHVLVMYAGTIAVPLILSVSLGLGSSDTVLLLNASLLTSGLATLLQCLGVWRFGARLPFIQGCSFIVLAPMIVIGKEYGLTTVFGATISCGLFTLLIAPLFSRLIKLFPPLVIGTVITIIGISLMPAAAVWLGGGNPAADDFGRPAHLLLGFATLLITMIFHAKSKGLLQSLSVLFGLVMGTLLAMLFGYADFSQVAQASWFGFSQPFAFGVPQFHLTPILVMCLAMLIVMAETTGNVLLIDKIIDQPTTQRRLADTIRADGLSTLLGGCLNSFPYNAFSQNAGLLMLTNVKSRFVVAVAGVILVILGLFPKIGAVIASIPMPVLGGAGILMFGMTIAAGIQELSMVPFKGTQNGLIVGLSIAIALLPMALPTLFSQLPAALRLIMESGIFIGGCAAVLLNMMINRPSMKGGQSEKQQSTTVTNY